MGRTFDAILTLIAILATIAELILITLPDIAPIFQIIPLSFLGLCLIYFLVYRPLISPQTNNMGRDDSQNSIEILVDQVVKRSLAEIQKIPPNNFNDEAQGLNAYKYFAERYGLGNKLIEVEWTIQDDGGAVLTRLIEIDAYSVVNTIETYLAIPEKHPSGKERDIDFLAIEPLGSNRVFEVSKVEMDRRLAVSLSLNRPLAKGESFGYKMQEKLPSGLYSINLTNREQKKRTDPRFDYVGWNINLPTRKVRLKIYFPEHFIPLVPFAEVRYASSAGFPQDREQPEETARLRDHLKVVGPEGGRYALSLEVDYPIVGFIYMVGWRPKTRDGDEHVNERVG